MKIIDLRSDTVTRPTPAMRAAMAAADVGDDVYGEDPTVRALEERAAERFGREGALFLPSGTMGNQIAVRLHTQPGQEVICEGRAHLLDWEMATMAAFSGCIPRTVEGAHGVLEWATIAKAIAPPLYYRAPTGLVWIENSHNMAGGTVTPPAVLESIWAGAREAKLATHCDGARIFNAVIAAGESVEAMTRGFDTVMFCLSKGLGAPVGSMLVGSAEHMRRARSLRKALGGGMRQAGYLAAAGIVALETMTERLAEDHANARRMAERLAAIPGVRIDLETVRTNLVFFRVPENGAANVVAKLAEHGVRVSAIDQETVRLVTHFDVSREDCDEAMRVLEQSV